MPHPKTPGLVDEKPDRVTRACSVRVARIMQQYNIMSSAPFSCIVVRSGGFAGRLSLREITMSIRFAALRNHHEHGRRAPALPLLRRRHVLAGAAAFACMATGAQAATLAHGAPRFGPVPDRDGATPWGVLAGIKLNPDGTVAEIAPAVEALDGTVIVLDGFMIPYDEAPRQRQFLLSPSLVDCPYCAPGGETGLVEVFVRRPVAVTQRPFSVRGRLRIMRDVGGGFLYSLVDAAT